MKLKNVILNNFQSFKNAEFDFESLKIVSINGKYKDENNRSNGSGKSTILDSIVYALYGKSRTKKSEDLIRENTNEMNVEIEFELNKNEIMKINRGIAKEKEYLNLIINKNDKTIGKRETQKLIEDKIGMDFDLFIATVFFQQEGADKFTSSGPTERKNYFKKLFKLEIYDKAYKEANKNIKKIDNQLLEIKGKMNYLKEQIKNTNVDSIKNNLKSENEKFEKVKKYLDKLIEKKEILIKENQKKKQLKIEIEKIKQNVIKYKKETSVFKTDLDNYKNSLKKLNLSLKNYKENIKDLPEFKEDQLECIKKSGEEKNSKIGKNEANVENIKMKITELKLKKNNIINEVKCSRCDTVLSFNYKEIFMNETDKNISILLVKKDSIQIELNQIKKELERNRNEYKKIKEVLTKKNEFQQYIELTEIEMKNKKNINEKTEFYLIENKDILEKNYEELKELNEELKDLNEKKENDILGKIEEKEKEKDILLKEINNLKNIKDNYLKQKKEYKIEKIIYDKLKWECNCFNILKNIFGKNGIVAEIIKESIEEVETEANNVLQEINNGEYRIIFDTIKETKKGEFSDSLDIYIENNRAVRIYESYSGGQRAIINFAIRMSLSKILSKLNNVSFGFVALDEVFGALDEHNKNKMIEVINYLKPFFYQILVISHTNLKECFENNIMIEFNKNTGISKIKEIY